MRSASVGPTAGRLVNRSPQACLRRSRSKDLDLPFRKISPIFPDNELPTPGNWRSPATPSRWKYQRQGLGCSADRDGSFPVGSHAKRVGAFEL